MFVAALAFSGGHTQGSELRNGISLPPILQYFFERLTFLLNFFPPPLVGLANFPEVFGKPLPRCHDCEAGVYLHVLYFLVAWLLVRIGRFAWYGLLISC